MKNIIWLVALLLSACVQKSTVTINTNVSEAELAPFRKTGTASITGQGFLRQKGGGVVTCAGSKVILAPDLPPIRQGIAASRAGHAVERAGRQWGNAGRLTKCDAQGNFGFENLPAANWYVFTEVKWQVGYAPQGGTLGAPVSTRGGGQTKIFLTDQDFISY